MEIPSLQSRVVIDYVQERNVGADAWRRTGVLTFDWKYKGETMSHSTVQKSTLKAFMRL